MNIADYVQAHTQRGECRCGRCVDSGERPDPDGHTADVFFFPVAANDAPDADEFRRLTRAHAGEFNACDPLDGGEHSYIELGGWIGDQGLALCYMGLGSLLGVYKLLTPKMLPIPPDMQQQLAGAGMIIVQAVRTGVMV